MKRIVFIVAGLLVLGLLGAGVASFFFLDWSSQSSQRETRNAVAAALQAMAYTQELQELLGFPFSQSEVEVQSSNLEAMGTSTMQLSFKVTGPNGSAKASCSMAKPQGGAAWYVTHGMVFPPSGPPISFKGRPAPTALQGF